jgi:hypothetical protein
LAEAEHAKRPRPEPQAVSGAMDMPWAKLMGQIAHAYGK